MKFLLPFLASLGLVSCQSGVPPKTVSNFQPARYVGEWHEIARLPNPFEKGLVAAKATYGLNQDGSLSVKNEGLKNDGRQTSITGRATPMGDISEGKLKVRFDKFPVSLFAGDYWILDLNSSYTRAIVGSPNRKTLWLLSKNPKDTPGDFTEAMNQVAAQGFDFSPLIKNPRRLP